MKKLIFILFILFTTQIVYAQNIVGVKTPCTTSSQGTVGNFIINYTIGEMPLIQTVASNGLLITQGILQPYKAVADTIYECYNQTEVTVYPNPNPGIFSLRLSLFKKGNVSIALHDMLGQKILNDAFEYNSFATKQYNISMYANGQYYLQLTFTELGTSKPKKCIYTIQKIK